MKVLIVGSHFAKYVSTLCSGLPGWVNYYAVLSHQNHQAEVGKAANEREATSITGEVDLVDFVSLRRPLVLVKNLVALCRRARNFNPSLIHAQESRSDSLCIWLLLFCWKPIVLTVHDIRPHPGRDSRIALRQRIYKYLIRRKASAIVVHGDYLRSRYMEVEGRPTGCGGRLVVIPHPALSPSRKCPARQPGLREPILLFFGRMEPYKGLEVLLEAVRRLHARGLKFVLHVVGVGPALDHVRHEIESLPFINLKYGFASARILEEEIQAADVIVAPYLEASQSGVLAYAIGFGKPVVATSVGSLPEVAIDGVNALVCLPGNADSLVTALARMIEDRELRGRLSMGSRKLAAGRLSARAVGHATASLYKQVIRPR